MSTPETPYTRDEMYLSAIADGDSSGIPDRPYTRKEKYLDAIATGDSSGIPDTPYTREEMYLDEIARNGGGGGGSTLIDKNVSANGTYNASDDNADGYKKVTVNVPNSYAAGDEGKVVSNGQLVAQTAHAEVNQNGTIDTTLNDSVVVNVSGGGGGLEYEMGTWTPTEDVAQPTINFSNSHTSLPFYALIFDITGTTQTTSNSNLMFEITTPDNLNNNFYGSSELYGRTSNLYRVTSYASGGGTNLTSQGTSGSGAIGTYLTATSFMPYTASDSRYWRSGRTYKWIAIWAPSQ